MVCGIVVLVVGSGSGRLVVVVECRVKFQLLDRFLGKILQPAILTHSASKVARSIDFDLKKILPSSEF